MNVEVIAELPCEIGEGPLWNTTDGMLYWTDIPAGRLHRYDPETRQTDEFYEGDTIAGFTFQRDGSILLFGADGVVSRLNADREIVVDGIPEEAGKRFNDVVADPQGRVFCGTMDEDTHVGRLYRLDTDGSITKLLDDVGLPNGMGFTPARDAMYFVESTENLIHRFPYDIETGELGEPTTFASLDDDEAMYDGLTVDADGTVWAALWGGGAIVSHDENGTIDRRIDVPATNVTSLTFGGPTFEDVYVTSATYLAPEADEAPGGLFHLKPGSRGVEEFRSRV